MLNAEGQRVTLEALNEALQEAVTTSIYKAVVQDTPTPLGTDIIAPDGVRVAMVRWADQYYKNWMLHCFRPEFHERVICSARRLNIERFGDVLRIELVGTETRHTLKAVRKAITYTIKDISQIVHIDQKRWSDFEAGRAVPRDDEWSKMRDWMPDLPERWTV